MDHIFQSTGVWKWMRRRVRGRSIAKGLCPPNPGQAPSPPHKFQNLDWLASLCSPFWFSHGFVALFSITKQAPYLSSKMPGGPEDYRCFVFVFSPLDFLICIDTETEIEILGLQPMSKTWNAFVSCPLSAQLVPLLMAVTKYPTRSSLELQRMLSSWQAGQGGRRRRQAGHIAS